MVPGGSHDIAVEVQRTNNRLVVLSQASLSFDSQLASMETRQ